MDILINLLSWYQILYIIIVLSDSVGRYKVLWGRESDQYFGVESDWPHCVVYRRGINRYVIYFLISRGDILILGRILHADVLRGRITY